jgi:hypothetical protein
MSSCSSNKQEDLDWSDINDTYLQVFNEDDQFLTVHDGDTLKISSLIDSRMTSVFSDWEAYALATARDSKWSNPERFIWIQPEEKDVSFHWLKIKQKTPSQYMFSIHKEKNDTIKEIIFKSSSSGPVSHANLYFKLE